MSWNAYDLSDRINSCENDIYDVMYLIDDLKTFEGYVSGCEESWQEVKEGWNDLEKRSKELYEKISKINSV